MKNSKKKGKLGELEAAAVLRRVLGVAARRGQQFCGGPDSPDVVADIPGVHFEVKRTERPSIYKMVEQAVRDAGESVPVVLFRSNRKPWLAIVPLEQLKDLAEKICEVTSGGKKAESGVDNA